MLQASWTRCNCSCRTGRIPTLKMHVRIVAHIYSIGGMVTATAGEFKASREIGQDAARQIYGHYLEKYGGNSIYLMSRKDMDDTAAMMLLEDDQAETP